MQLHLVIEEWLSQGTSKWTPLPFIRNETCPGMLGQVKHKWHVLL